MSHFALVKNGIVEQVIVAEQDFIDNVMKPNTPDGEWIQTSYNTYGGVHYDPSTDQPSTDQTKALRKNFAGVGFTYDLNADAFISPKPFASWLLNTTSYLWEAPVAYPNDGNDYRWDEATQTWDLIPTT